MARHEPVTGLAPDREIEYLEVWEPALPVAAKGELITDEDGGAITRHRVEPPARAMTLNSAITSLPPASATIAARTRRCSAFDATSPVTVRVVVPTPIRNRWVAPTASARLAVTRRRRSATSGRPVTRHPQLPALTLKAQNQQIFERRLACSGSKQGERDSDPRLILGCHSIENPGDLGATTIGDLGN